MDEKPEQGKKQVTARKKSELSVEASMERLRALLEELEASNTSLEGASLFYEKDMKPVGEINE